MISESVASDANSLKELEHDFKHISKKGLLKYNLQATEVRKKLFGITHCALQVGPQYTLEFVDGDKLNAEINSSSTAQWDKLFSNNMLPHTVESPHQQLIFQQNKCMAELSYVLQEYLGFWYVVNQFKQQSEQTSSLVQKILPSWLDIKQEVINTLEQKVGTIERQTCDSGKVTRFVYDLYFLILVKCRIKILSDTVPSPWRHVGTYLRFVEQQIRYVVGISYID